MGKVDLLRTFLLPAARLGELASNPPVEGGISAFALILQRDGRELERVKDVAEVELRESRDSLAIVTHARGRGGLV